METSVALISAKTVSPSFRFIRSTEPVVITDVTIPAAVRITTSDTTLSETIFSTVPGKRFRILVLMASVLSHNFERHHAFVLVFHDAAVKHKAADNFRIGKRNLWSCKLVRLRRAKRQLRGTRESSRSHK